MSYVDDVVAGGYLPLQHHESQYDLSCRAVKFGMRIKERDHDFRYVPRDDTVGDLVCALLWPADKATREKDPAGETLDPGASTVVRNPANSGGGASTGARDAKNAEDKNSSPTTAAREIPGWAFAWPAIVTSPPRHDTLETVVRNASTANPDDPGTRPVRDRDFRADVRFREIRPALARLASKLPRGWPVVVLAGVEERSQEELVFPAYHVLVAVNGRDSDPDLGTIVADLTKEQEVDVAHRAPLHSAWRVVNVLGALGGLGGGVRGSLAWQLTRSGRDGLAGLGLVVDHAREEAKPPPAEEDGDSGPEGTRPRFPAPDQRKGNLAAGREKDTSAPSGDLGTLPRNAPASPEAPKSPPPPLVTAASTARLYGPLETGNPGDTHRLGDTDVGPLHSLHLATSALFLGHDGDGPLDFELGRYDPPPSHPSTARVHLLWDKGSTHPWAYGMKPGRWRWLAEAPASFLEKKPPGGGKKKPPLAPPRRTPPTAPPATPPVVGLAMATDAPPAGAGGYALSSAPTFPVPPGAIDLPQLRPAVGLPRGTVPHDALPAVAGVAPTLGTAELPPPPWAPAPAGYETLLDDAGHVAGDAPTPTAEPTSPVLPMSPSTPPHGHVATTLEYAFPAIAFRPPVLREAEPELRYANRPGADDADRYQRFAPVVLRLEPYAKQAAAGFPEYTARGPGARYESGTGPGGLVFLPGELGMEDVDEAFSPPGRSTSTVHLVAGPGVYWAAGLPDRATGSISVGHRWAQSGGNTVFEAGDGTTFNECMALTQAGGRFGHGASWDLGRERTGATAGINGARVQLRRGTAALLPTLAAGELYAATDTGELFVGY